MKGKTEGWLSSQKFFKLLVFLLPIQLGRHLWPEFSYVLGLRIDYLSPTIYLTDLLVGIILLLWAFENYQNFKFQVSSSLIFPISIFIFLLVNCLFAQSQGAAFYKLIKIIEFSLLGFYVAKNHYSLFTIHYSFAGAVIYSSLIAFAQFVKQGSLGGVFWWLGERTFNAGTPGIAKIALAGRLLMRPYATFPHPNVLAGFALVSLILILTRNSKPVTQRLVNWIAFVLGLIAILISFSRSAWLIGLLIALMTVGWFKRLRVVSYVLVVAGVAALLLISARGGSALGGKLPFFTEESFAQRLELNKIAIQLIKQQPLIGVGLNNFIVRLPDFWRGPTFLLQPVHNLYLLVAAELGVVGLAIFLWFLFLTYRRLITYHPSLLIALTTILLLGLFDHYWFTLQQTQLLLAIVLGLAWGSAKIAS